MVIFYSFFAIAARAPPLGQSFARALPLGLTGGLPKCAPLDLRRIRNMPTPPVRMYELKSERAKIIFLRGKRRSKILVFFGEIISYNLFEIAESKNCLHSPR